MIISERIKKIRLEKGLTQKEFVKGLNMSAATLSGCESRATNPSIASIVEIAKKYNVSLDWLLGVSNERWIPKFVTYANILDLITQLTCPNYKAKGKYEGGFTLFEISALPKDKTCPVPYVLSFDNLVGCEYSDNPELTKNFSDKMNDLLKQYTRILNLFRRGDIDGRMFTVFVEDLKKRFDININVEAEVIRKITSRNVS